MSDPTNLHYARRVSEAYSTTYGRLRELLPSTRRPVPDDPPLKRDPKPVMPKLNLRDYVASEAGPPPVVRRDLSHPLLTDVLGNMDWGDCGDAMTLHGIEAMHLAGGTVPPRFTLDDALTLYSEVSGFDPRQGPPGANPTDMGTDNQSLVDYWRDVGVICKADGSKHNIVGSVFVDLTDEVVARVAIWEFVVLFRAVGLPVAARGQTHWQVTDPSLQGDAAVGSWGYHDIPYLAYDENSVLADSWGQLIPVDWSWDRAYGVQGFVVVSEDMRNLQGMGPGGVDWTRLNQDLAKFPPAQQ